MQLPVIEQNGLLWAYSQLLSRILCTESEPRAPALPVLSAVEGSEAEG